MQTWGLFAALMLWLAPAHAKLYSNALVNCMKNSTTLQPDYFNVVFDPEDRSLNYDVSLTANIEGKLKAHATVYAFGFNIIEKNFDMCSLGMKQFCPITASKIEVQSVQYIDQDYVDMVPGIAYHFPDIDAVARLIITDETNHLLGCLQATINNGKTVSHEGAKWATAVVAGICLLISAGLSLFGNSASASRMSAFAVSLFTYFQSVVIVSMLRVESAPPIAASWSENLAWSMGIIRVEFMQNIFRWYIQATGGVPTQYLTTSAKQILTQRDNGVADLAKIATLQEIEQYFIPLQGVQSNNYLNILRGLERVSYGANIEPTSLVCTTFTFFVFFLYVLVGLYFTFRGLTKIIKNSNKSAETPSKIQVHLNDDKEWAPIFKGLLSRYLYIAFPQLVIFSLWEFTRNDSAGILTLSVFFFLLAMISMVFCIYKVFYYARASIRDTGNPAAYLYGNEEVLARYGFMYTMLDARKYWFSAVILGHTFVKALFVSLSQGSGKTQALALWIIDMAYLGVLIHFEPYLDRLTNILSIFIAVVVTLNSFFFTFFSNVYNQPQSVGPVMGIIFFILNAAVSLILLLMIIAVGIMMVFFKNPDSKFSPTKDDRTSFQKGTAMPMDEKNELFNLGMVAKDHQPNWRHTMYGSPERSRLSLPAEQQDDDHLHRQLSTASSKFGKVWGKLSRGLSHSKRHSHIAGSSEEDHGDIDVDLQRPSPKMVYDEDEDDEEGDDLSYEENYQHGSQSGGSYQHLPVPVERPVVHVTTPSMDSGALDPNNPFKPILHKRTSMDESEDPFEH